MSDYTLDDLLARRCFGCGDQLHLSDPRWLLACDGVDVILCDVCLTPRRLKRLQPIVTCRVVPTYHYSRDP